MASTRSCAAVTRQRCASKCAPPYPANGQRQIAARSDNQLVPEHVEGAIASGTEQTVFQLIRVTAHDVIVELEEQVLHEGGCIAQSLNSNVILDVTQTQPFANDAVVWSHDRYVAQQTVVDRKSAEIEIQTRNEKILDCCLPMLIENSAVVILSRSHLRPFHQHEVAKCSPRLLRVVEKFLKDCVLNFLMWPILQLAAANATQQK